MQQTFPVCIGLQFDILNTLSRVYSMCKMLGHMVTRYGDSNADAVLLACHVHTLGDLS